MLKYIDIHTNYTLPVLFILAIIAFPCFQIDPHRTWIPIALLSIVSFLYTTPWDNYLVKMGGWTYPPNSVLYVVGYIPIEEYCFFIIQTMMTGFLFVIVRWITTAIPLARIKPLPMLKVTVLGLLGLIGLMGWQIAVPGSRTFYLGSILYWTMPVLILQFFFAFEYLWNLKRVLFSIIGCSTLYLWMVDTIAIRHGAWAIAQDATLGIFINPTLPLEEALFFFLTNCMVVFGLGAVERTWSILDLNPCYSSKHRDIKLILEATWSSEFIIPQSTILDLEKCYQVIKNASTSFYFSTLLLPVTLRYKIWKLYAFARTCDDFIDLASTLKEKQAKIEMMESFLKNPNENHPEPSFRAIQTLKISFQPLLDMVKGFKMDIVNTRFKTENELYEYCYCVASTIGLASIDIFDANELGEQAKALGLALQLVNIARDVAEDWIDNKRIYLIGIEPSQVTQWLHGDNVKVQEQIQFLLTKYDAVIEHSGIFEAIDKLPFATRRAVLASFVMYNQIALKIKNAIQNDPKSLKKRIRVDTLQSITMLILLYFFPNFFK